MNRKPDSGVILINVLVVLALGAAIIVLMFVSQEGSLTRSQRAFAQAQGQAIASGAELTAVLALQRDMITAPDTDHFTEEWAQVQQERVNLATGEFSLTITDVQSRFDINSLAGASVVQQQIFARLLAALELPAALGPAIIQEVTRKGRVSTLDEIESLDPTSRDILDPVVACLPIPGSINVNTADTVVLSAVLANPAAVRQLIARRTKAGFLTRDDLRDVGVIVLNGAGFTSDVFDVAIRAEVDGTKVDLHSRLVRIPEIGGGRVIVNTRQLTSLTRPLRQ
jgi:general secretion pathway protein K